MGGVITIDGPLDSTGALLVSGGGGSGINAAQQKGSYQTVVLQKDRKSVV